MKSRKILKLGVPGTKRWMLKYGEDLYCVRYRYDIESKERITTVEIIVDRSKWEVNNKKIPKNKMIEIDLRFEETDLRRLVKNAGGRWNREKKVWEMAYGEILSLGLTKRIIKKSY